VEEQADNRAAMINSRIKDVRWRLDAKHPDSLDFTDDP
jgi:hypothetical protein